MRNVGLALALVGALMLTTSCNVASPSTNKTDTFTATVQPGGEAAYQFTAGSGSGEYSMSVKSMSPDTNAQVLMALTYSTSATTCGGIIQEAITGIGIPGLNGGIVPGAYCVVVSGAYLLRPQTFSITISHP